VQAGYDGPAPQWHNAGPDSLSTAQVAELEAKVAADAEDICARGYLIAHGADGAWRRADDLLWMIDHHPEWDGFLIGQRVRGERPPTLPSDIRSAWLRQIGTSQGKPIVLHHAAKFFDHDEPFLAEELLLRAIRMEPDEPLHVEGLSDLYARGTLPFAQVPAFRAHAMAKLLSTNDPLILAGAVNALRPYAKGYSEPWRTLYPRLGDPAKELIRKLPSRSEKYRKARCPVIPLLHKCVEKP